MRSVITFKSIIRLGNQFFNQANKDWVVGFHVKYVFEVVYGLNSVFGFLKLQKLTFLYRFFLIMV